MTGAEEEILPAGLTTGIGMTSWDGSLGLRAVPLFLKSLKMAVGLCCALLLACTPAAPPDAPNVVLVTLDTVRADYLGLYGHPRETSPELDEFARGAFVFEQAIAQSAVTPVSHASILTGLRPYQHGLRSLHGGANFALPDEQQTLAEMLAARGYATAAFVSAFTATRYYGLHQGFESWDQAFAGNDGAGRVNEAGIVNTGDAQRTAVETTRRALKWLEARKPGPFFLWLHYFDAHDPDVIAPAEVQARFPPATRNRHDLLRAAYEGEIAVIDTELGKLFAALDAAGVREQTLIAIVGDHGQGMGDHGWWGHGILYQEQLRVPFILSLPGLGGGKRIHSLVRTTDPRWCGPPIWCRPSSRPSESTHPRA
ncbi:MAG: sulfatase [Deltaproteobacteria bacterium]|nr:sulfatase [Deltaproteobacteria bacterium]